MLLVHGGSNCVVLLYLVHMLTLSVRELAYAQCRGYFATQSVVPRPTTSASPENLLEMQNLNPHPRLNESACVLTRSPGDSSAHSSLRSTDLESKC